MAVICEGFPRVVVVVVDGSFPGKGCAGNGGKDRSCRGFGPSFGGPKWTMLLDARRTGSMRAGGGGDTLE